MLIYLNIQDIVIYFGANYCWCWQVRRIVWRVNTTFFFAAKSNVCTNSHKSAITSCLLTNENTYFERCRRIKKKVVIGKLRILLLHVQITWPPAQLRCSRPVNQTKIKPQQNTPKEVRKQFPRNESDRLDTNSGSVCNWNGVRNKQFHLGNILSSHSLPEFRTTCMNEELYPCVRIIHNLKSWKRWVVRDAVNMLCGRSGRCVNKFCCVLKNVVFHMRYWLSRRHSNTANWISMWCGCW